MMWQLHVEFQEAELRDAYWEQVCALPQLQPLLESGALRPCLHLALPVVRVMHPDRDALAPLCRWTLDFWPSAQIGLALVTEGALQREAFLTGARDFITEHGPGFQARFGEG
ncbi:hypothetical protein ACFPC0_10865 [Streptomyces andamanensis]|uniref:Uncharacterized protein n=1 Tax=Streptomyces andamanensis TaxID=1565035 RepID=A0ABV8TCF6_9ACTN